MSYPDLDLLIPHRPPMRFVDEIVGEENGAIVCRGRIPIEFSAGGSASPLLGLELGAQAAAVMGALQRWPATEGTPAPPIGYLVSVRVAEISAPSIPAGQPLTVRVRTAGSVYPLARYEISIYADEKAAKEQAPLISATIGTYLITER